MEPKLHTSMFQQLILLLKKSRIKIIFIFCAIILVLIFSGFFDIIKQVEYFEDLKYPAEKDIAHYVSQLKAGAKPDLPPINKYQYKLKIDLEDKCRDEGWKSKYQEVKLLLLVKSSPKNSAQRDAIRQTWGWEKRFSDVTVKRVFIVGVSKNDKHLDKSIEEENGKYLDIIQANFIDSSYNNTIKTLVAFNWAIQNCPGAQFIFLSDDDMYVSIKNILRFLRNPYHYPEYMDHNLEAAIPGSKGKGILGAELLESHLYAGFVFYSQPQHKRFSKLYTSLISHPYHKFPPYVTAGAYILSMESLRDIYYTSYYTKYLPSDDIFLGHVAKTARITPVHNEQFLFWKKKYKKESYKYVIVSHGYDDPNEMIGAWNDQRNAGNA